MSNTDFTITFVNASTDNDIEEIKKKGNAMLLQVKDDLEFYKEFSFPSEEDFDDIKSELRDKIRKGNYSFSQIRRYLKKMDELGGFENYGLCFDFVPVDTFDDQDEGYYRLQLSYGGPSDEFRFYPDGSIEYVFLDWFVGVGFDVTGADWIEDVKTFFEDVGSLNFEDISGEDLYKDEEEDEDEEEEDEEDEKIEEK